MNEVISSKDKKPLWTCPKCGNKFVIKNLWHSCNYFNLEDHFKGKDPIVHKLFDKLHKLIRKNGSVIIIPQKSRIAIQVCVRFAGGVAHKNWFDAALWLTRKAKHKTLRKIIKFGPNSFGHQFRLKNLKDLDKDFEKLIREAFPRPEGAGLIKNYLVRNFSNKI